MERASLALGIASNSLVTSSRVDESSFTPLSLT